MSSPTVIAAIVCLLGALVCYAFITQSISAKHERRHRALIALKARSRNLKSMMQGFPAGFLTTELTLAVQRNLADMSEQLSKLEPHVPLHQQNFHAMHQQIAETQQQAKPRVEVQMANHRQVKEASACLEELHKFIIRQQEKSQLSQKQGYLCEAQIKHLGIQVTLDGYWLSAMQASESNKIKLAIHYHGLALNLIIRETKEHIFAGRVEQLREQITRLRLALVNQDAGGPPSPLSEEANHTDEEANQIQWKKKTVYD